MSRPFSVAVYCGSRFGDSPAFAQAARTLGELIGRSGATLVYGGGRVGLMGTVADAVMASGGQVVGVIPQALMDREVGHSGLTELHVVQTMHERKQLMAERADAFISLPGGIGTMDLDQRPGGGDHGVGVGQQPDQRLGGRDVADLAQ